MRFKLLIPAIFCTALFSHAAIAQQTTQAPDNTAQIRQLVLDSCKRDEDSCNCLANSMSNAFSTDKELSIMIALASDADEPPANITEEDLRAFAEKMRSAASQCD